MADIPDDVLDDVELEAARLAGCFDHFDSYNPHDPGPIGRFRSMWPRDQAVWTKRVLARLREERSR